ncbi:MAG: hypothetical protein H0T76_03700 [Nannocystis sp.]|nr:hypothetical protein [Nannocystis sp.]MBA3545566.1 hypothetical protein [Nannocystis sp.]
MDIAPHLGENESVPRRRILLLSLVLACGPGSSDTDAGTTTAASSTSTGDTPTSAAETTQAATTGPTTGPVTTDVTTTDITATSTGDVSTGTGTSTGDSSTTGTTGEDMVEYAAFFGAGGLDHLLIFRADALNDRCTSIHFARPVGPMPGFAITAPNEWNFVNAFVRAGTDGCLAGTPMGDPVIAIGGAGAGTWQQDPNQFCPLMLDLDVALDFPQDQPWVPAQELMLVTAVPVQSCP